MTARRSRRAKKWSNFYFFISGFPRRFDLQFLRSHAAWAAPAAAIFQILRPDPFGRLHASAVLGTSMRSSHDMPVGWTARQPTLAIRFSEKKTSTSRSVSTLRIVLGVSETKGAMPCPTSLLF